ncbi:MAG TPA: helix-turn-helix domain-containing protein [Anaerolineales bacterium]|nr:helix-turn-helix domain-containing protein [Anaerolineales bacterium]
MDLPLSPISLNSFTTFGDLLKYMRRHQRLTQLELSIAVGYSEAQISRLEKNQRTPDLTVLKALFIPALHLEDEPQLIARFMELAQTARQLDAPTPGIPPYKGLLFFDESDSELFFGREALTARLAGHVIDLAKDTSTRFLAVVGASGSGKSSLVRAGLAVALQRAGWEARVFTPTANPLGRLEANLDLARTGNAERALILVDQFEEVFTLCHDEMQRITFIEKLLSAAQDESKKMTVVIALRADFYSYCAQYPLLRQAVAAEQVYIGQMTLEELKRAIEEPSRRGGWELEPGLVDVLLNDIGAQGASEPEPGALPLLSHALHATWERRSGRILTLDGYHASGGVRGAIAETAESVFNDQLNQTQRELARDVFLRLTKLGEGTEDTRRRTALNELVRQSAEATELRAVLNILTESRLIILNEDSAEVAHEALIREWHRLHEWLTQDREGLLLHRHLTESAHEWEAREQDQSELYRGARLAQAREWALANNERLNASEQAFLAASIDQEQHDTLEREAQRQRELETAQKLAETEKARAEEQASSVKRLRLHRIFLTSALVLAIIAAIFAGIFASTSRQQALISAVRELSSSANLNLEIDPELSILLALQAVNKTYGLDHTVLPEAEDALHRAVQASRVELTLRGHADFVSSAVFSPDGTRIATASADGMAKIWDAATGKELLTLKGSSYGVAWYAVFSPDGKLLATAGQDKIARIWDASTGGELLALSGHSRDVYQIVFSPDGSRVATISDDGTSKVWDALTGRELLKISARDGGIPQWVAFSPDGSRIAIAYLATSIEGWANIWDVVTGQMLLTLPHQNAYMRSVSFAPDGTRIVTTGDDQTARIWDADNGKELITLYGHTDKVTNAAYNPDGTRIATVSWDRQVVVWDAATGQELFTLLGHSRDIWSVAFSPDGTRLVTASKDRTARVWSVSPSREYQTLVNVPVISSPVEAKLAYSPDGNRLAVAYSDPTTKVWDLANGKLLLSLAGHTDGVNFIAYNFDGTHIATAARDRTAKVWNAVSGEELLTLSGHDDSVLGVAFSPDDSRLATASLDSTAKIWDAGTGKTLLTLYAPDRLTDVAFSPDGSRIATSGFDGTAIVWDAVTGKRLFPLIGHPDTVRQIVFSPNGARLATASFDGSAKLWDAASGKELLTFSGHSGSVFGVAFSPDGKTIATASGDKTAKLWDAQTGQELLTLHAPDGLTSVAFSPDGSQLATASRDGTNRIYLLKLEDLVTLAKQRVTRALTTEECQQYLHIKTCPDEP